MRRFTILLILLLSVLPKVLAQEGLSITPFFSQEFFEKPGITTVTVTGKKLKKTGIDIYRSLTVTGNPESSNLLEQAEVSFRDGKLHFGFYTLKPHDRMNRYILYLNRTEEGKRKTTLIYLEGTGDTNQIKKFLNKEDI